MRRPSLRGQEGFTMIEMLMVLAVMSFVLVAVYGFHTSQVESYHTQEDVADVQQNLRAAMETITKDLRMAGFLVPAGTNPLSTSTATSISMSTATIHHAYARVTASAAGTSFTVNVDPADVDQFASGHKVRIIRTQDSTSLGVCDVTGTGASSLTLDTCTASISTVKGDLIARITNGTGHPNTIVYQVTTGGSCPSGQSCVGRVGNGTTQVLADHLASGGLQFEYFLDGSTTPTAVAGITDWSQVKAVRVTLTGQTIRDVAELGGADRQRRLTSMVSIRNR